MRPARGGAVRSEMVTHEVRAMDEQQPGTGAVRSVAATLALLAALLFGGMAIGLSISLAIAGGSIGSIIVGFLALPLTFGLAMVAWRWVLVAWIVSKLAGSIVRSRGDETRFRADLGASMEGARASRALPGTWVFVPVCSAVGVMAALAMAIAADGDRLIAGGAILAAAVAYGLGLKRLAQRGLLPIPEE